MNHHRYPCFVPAFVLLIVGAFAATSYGQLPPGIVTNPDPSPQRALIETFVATQVKLLQDPDSVKWGMGRSLVMNEVAKQGATQGFADVYADVINTQLLVLIKDQKDARVRLNAAIIAARIASKAGNGKLAPITLALLKDNSDAVVLWGLQTAKYVVPALLASGVTADIKTADTISKAAVQATKDHMTPAVIEESYRTLLLNPTLPDPGSKINDIEPKTLALFLPNTVSLFEYRIKLYDEEQAPKQAEVDTWAATFLTTDKVWTAQSTAQRGQTLGLMLDLLKGAAKQNAVASSPEMLDVIKRTGQAFIVVGDHLKQADLKTAAQKMAGIPASAAPDEITTAITNLEAAVKALGLPVTTASTP